MTVRVRPLDWIGTERNGVVEYWRAESGLHQYSEYEVYAIGQGLFRADFEGSRIMSGEAADKCKAAAQGDFERRILSALLSPEAPASSKEEGE